MPEHAAPSRSRPELRRFEPKCVANSERIDSRVMSTTKPPAPPLDAQTRVQFLHGVGPQRAQAFERLGIATLEHLVRHYPRTWLDASRFVKVKDLTPGELLTIVGDVKHASVLRTRGGRTDFAVTVSDG